MEIDALLGTVVELGTLTGREMPMCCADLALVREQGRLAGGRICCTQESGFSAKLWGTCIA